MAIALDSATPFDTGGAAQNSHTFAHTVAGSDRILLVGFGMRSGGQTIASVTYNGVGLTQIASVSPSTQNRTDLWYLVAPAIGTNNVVITVAASATSRMAGGAVSYTGVNQASPLGTHATNSATTGTAVSVSVNSAAGELVVDTASNQDSAITLTVDASQSQRYQDVTTNATTANNVRGAGSDEAGAASVTMSWTLSGNEDWSIIAVPLKPSTTKTLAALGVG